MNKDIYFDDALPTFAKLVEQLWGTSALHDNLFLQDVTGRLTFVVLGSDVSAETRKTLAEAAHAMMPRYVDPSGFAVATPEELFEDDLAASARVIHIDHPTFRGPLRLVDRRLIGGDWLRQPASTKTGPLRVVFASIKGGVGRSTALCVTAAHLASHGRRVLAIDMDLEAPGLGNMLLPSDTLPEFGLLDYLVEQNLGEIDDQFYADMVGSSWLGGGKGRVDVIPAIGRRSLQHPAGVLAKIARAYLPGASVENGDQSNQATTFLDHIGDLVDRFSDPLRYDFVLIDARAGLHETTAASIIGLGGEVLLFGIDQPQTIAGYRLLLAHLGNLPVSLDNDWRSSLTFVHAKAPVSLSKKEVFLQKISDLFSSELWKREAVEDSALDLDELAEVFEVDWENGSLDGQLDEYDITNNFITVLDDSRYSFFDPLNDPQTLDQSLYHETFRELLDRIDLLANGELFEEYLDEQY